MEAQATRELPATAARLLSRREVGRGKAGRCNVAIAFIQAIFCLHDDRDLVLKFYENLAGTGSPGRRRKAIETCRSTGRPGERARLGRG